MNVKTLHKNIEWFYINKHKNQHLTIWNALVAIIYLFESMTKSEKILVCFIQYVATEPQLEQPS